MIRWLIVALLFALPLRAEEIVMGMSHEAVNITTDFDGSDILIFGAVKREAPIATDALGVIVTVSGPDVPVVVRRKARRFGIWVNTEEVGYDHVPSFYAVATSGPMNEVLDKSEDYRHDVSIPSTVLPENTPPMAFQTRRFSQALARLRMAEGTFQRNEGAVTLREETLFKTQVRLPANLVEGTYETRVLLTRYGRIISDQRTPIEVRKVGLERFLFTLSREQPLVYGVLALFIAGLAGWGASAAFRLIRQG